MVGLRERGLQLANRSFLALLVGMVILVFVYNVSAGKGPATDIVVALVGLCVIALGIGTVMLVAALTVRRSATRFLRQPARVTAGPADAHP
jgi:hypothetical protein